MKIISKKQADKLLNLAAANQIILNAYASHTLDGFAEIQAFSQFCDNTSEMIFMLGGVEALTEAKDFLFTQVE